MQRFYTLSLEPILFGDVALVRNWGRIGTRGQTKQHFFDKEMMAQSALDTLHVQKTRRG